MSSYEKQFVNGTWAYLRGFGPEPLGCGTYEGTQYLVERRQPGMLLEAGRITPKQAACMAAFYTRLSTYERGEQLSPEDWHRRVYSYREKVVQQHHAKVPDEYRTTIERALAVERLLTEHVKRNLAVLKRQRKTMRHGDSNPKNFFYYKRAIHAIDWVDSTGPLCLDTSDFLCKARLQAKAEAAFLQGLPKDLREATTVWRPVRAYTAVWWDLDEAYRNRVEKQLTLRTYAGNLRHANTVLGRIECYFRTGEGVVL
jgi:hypothetical protein